MSSAINPPFCYVQRAVEPRLRATDRSRYAEESRRKWIQFHNVASPPLWGSQFITDHEATP
jgi:hypothetical protein